VRFREGAEREADGGKGNREKGKEVTAFKTIVEVVS
jgi:hypothetical protein